MVIILKQHHISLPKGTRNTYHGSKTDDHESCHALKAGFSKSQAFLINFGASNHMVSTKKSFASLNITNGLSIHMGYDTQI